jgi:hypothetical protein
VEALQQKLHNPAMRLLLRLEEEQHCCAISATCFWTTPYTDFTLHIVAYHPDAHTLVENNLILWWSGVAKLQRDE